MASGVGKTTVATGLLAALRSRPGLHPAGAKAGPDFIDPGYHALACGRAPRNLDPWLCGAAAIPGLAARAAEGAGLLVVEGVMGLFDGAADGSPSSTADVARLLDAPVILVVDASGMSRSVAAVVHGFRTWDPTLRIAGVILNRVGSDVHEAMLREALDSDLPVLGVLRRDDRFTWRDRHLGLVPVAERRPEVAQALDTLAAAVAESVDLDAVVRLAASAPARATAPVALPPPGPPVRIAVAAGHAFTFTYTDTLDALAAGGAEIVPFDPCTAAALPPDLDGLLAGGGFPEVYAAELAANRPLLDDVAAAMGRGLPTWAECGGLLWLAGSLDGHRMAGVVPGTAVLTDRLTLGYRTATANRDTPVGPTGTTLRGHEFHYSRIDPPGDALTLSGRWGNHADGTATPTLLATYLHHHPGGDPTAVANFLATCRFHRASA